MNSYQKILVSGGPIKVHWSYQDTTTLRFEYLWINRFGFHLLSHLKDDLYKIQMDIDPWAKLQSFYLHNKSNKLLYHPSSLCILIKK